MLPNAEAVIALIFPPNYNSYVFVRWYDTLSYVANFTFSCRFPISIGWLF